MTEDFERPIDKQIREARERGDFDNLPGKGKPLQWEDESMVPEDQRLAQRLLKHNDFTLDWIALSQEIDADWEVIEKQIERARAARAAGEISARAWTETARILRDKIKALNLRVIGYNLRAPHERVHKRPFPIDPDLKEE